MALLELIEKRADADLVREMLAFAAELLMALEVETLTGAPAGVRSPERLNHRNGHRERAWDTRAGRIDLASWASVSRPAATAAASGAPGSMSRAWSSALANGPSKPA